MSKIKMNILIPDSWLRDFLKTDASAGEIAKYLSLCGPSVEKVEKTNSDSIYSIEVTTNRVDVASVYGIAREAVAILPQFGIKSSLHPIKLSHLRFVGSVKYLKTSVDHNLCQRFTAVLIKNTRIGDSPAWIKDRLVSVGVRPINNIVDISNYVMHELGQPVHTFDYDKIIKRTMTLRESKRGERLTTLDGKNRELAGKDIVIADGSARLIDLAGIMGGQNSAVDYKTKNVLLFVQTYSPAYIRKTSMALAHRTEAAELFEKGLDPQLVTLGISRGIELFEKLTGGRAEKEILDIYPNPIKPKMLKLNLDFINTKLGVSLSKKDISQILGSLGFEVDWKGEILTVGVPSWRTNDISIPEDIVEEVARIHGYYKLPSNLMQGQIPEPLSNPPFDFEIKVKSILKGYGGIEIYTLSLVSESEAPEGLKIKNPLGGEGEYLRTSLMSSLIKAVKENSGEKEPFHLFEMANIYLPRRSTTQAGVPDLPEEKMTLAGIFSNSSFRTAKGVIESLLGELNFDGKFIPEEGPNFLPGRRLVIKSGAKVIGAFGEILDGYFYYQIDVEELRAKSKSVGRFTPIPKYPAQVEDITLKLPTKTQIGRVITSMLSSNSLISKVELKDVYLDSNTFRVWYQNSDKTLTDAEVEKVRTQLLKSIKETFGGILKS